ncbi:MAG: serine/threonine-protein kinase [Pseudomonadota bacterium]
MEPPWQTKLWIETTLKRRPEWQGASEEDDDSDSLSLTYSPDKSKGIPNWEIGESILGRYKVLEARGGPGKSGMGVVFVVLDRESGNIYAAKTLQDWCANHVRARKRFEREAKMWIELENHPNIVKAYFLEHIDERPYLFLEFVPGVDVSRMVRSGPLPARLAVKYGIQICRAMNHASRRFSGFVHRDIKPSNCLTTQENLKLSDFGLAKAMDRLHITLIPGEGKGDRDSSISRESRALGTLPYMAPELFGPQLQQDARSDVYSFGITMYKMMTSQFPFRAKTEEGWMDCHVKAEPKDPWEHAPNIPAIIRELILKCLEKNPDKRPPDFNIIGDMLSSVLLRDFYERLPRDAAERLEVSDIINKASSYSWLGFHSEALEFYDRALRMNPESASAWSGKAITLSQTGSFEEAVMCCDKATAIDEFNPLAWTTKGRILARSGKHEEAVKSFDMVLKTRKEAAYIMLEKGESLFSLKRHEEALACYSDATDLQPSSTTAWLMKAIVLMELGRYEACIRSANKAIKLEGGEMGIAWACTGDAYLRMGKLSKAEKCFSKAVRIDSEYPFYQILLGCTYVRMGKKDLGLKCFTRAKKLDPGMIHYLRSIDEYKSLASS